jgi:hypothetical protein
LFGEEIFDNYQCIESLKGTFTGSWGTFTGQDGTFTGRGWDVYRKQKVRKIAEGGTFTGRMGRLQGGC